MGQVAWKVWDLLRNFNAFLKRLYFEGRLNPQIRQTVNPNNFLKLSSGGRLGDSLETRRQGRPGGQGDKEDKENNSSFPPSPHSPQQERKWGRMCPPFPPTRAKVGTHVPPIPPSPPLPISPFPHLPYSRALLISP
ncbi:hypothetical protein PI95_019460 [Hassallia byssoidea VB512170]|uniref:Uncharacterized protein n=1 Tax=Hassallia byssoidea VB512170 TaxID=1304833 RepID=A0A846HC90_9CYAN|nr:hypothetical protein [Hassalia byssoidea]NEU74673.1 hypothetical protein [Hassalia byssoidea VB512170]